MLKPTPISVESSEPLFLFDLIYYPDLLINYLDPFVVRETADVKHTPADLKRNKSIAALILRRSCMVLQAITVEQAISLVDNSG